jgi:phage terminase large subunit GpA-like protein
LVLCDECDRYPTSAGSEGDPIQLARKRAATFWNRKIVMVSTPTNKGASRIEDAFEQSDQRHYHVPCKHCEQYQVLKWANVQWQDSDPETAQYCCEHCGSLWSDAERRWAIRNGQWVAHAEFTGVAGFAINGMYSPWTPLSDGVRDFLSVRKNPEQLRVWTNTYLGETFEDAGETIEPLFLTDRVEDYEILVPEEVVLLTAGADVQNDRIEISIIGWTRDFESFVIGHEVVRGDPSTPQLWQQVDSVLFKRYETYDEREMTIRATAMDSGGHFTNSVYQYAKKNAGSNVFAIKGVGGEGKPIAGRPSKNNIGRVNLFPVGVDTAKDLLFARLRIEEPGPGYIHFPKNLDDEYFKQLTAEKVVTRFHRGFKKRVFQKIRARNEALDCFVYAMAALAILNVDVNTLADRAKFKHNSSDDTREKEPKRQLKQPFVPKTGSGFVNSWR